MIKVEQKDIYSGSATPGTGSGGGGTGVVYTYKGTVTNYSDLPASGQEVGDVYNITNADSTHDIKAGDNVAWSGTAWNNLGGTINLSNYYTKSEVDSLVGDSFTAAEVETIWENV